MDLPGEQDFMYIASRTIVIKWVNLYQTWHLKRKNCAMVTQCGGEMINIYLNLVKCEA